MLRSINWCYIYYLFISKYLNSSPLNDNGLIPSYIWKNIQLNIEFCDIAEVSRESD